MNNIKTILASAYAVNPFKGSEDGMGWNFIYQIARYNKVIAVTRENNRQAIEQYMNEQPDIVYQNIRFVYFDLPYWMRFWKKGSRGAMLYYTLWQRALPSYIKKQNLHFDVVHNLNFHNDWTPSYLWKLNKPFVWGPIGHHPLIPKHYLIHYSKKYLIKDRITWLVKLFFWNYSPALQKTIQKADHILCMNQSVPNALNLKKNTYSIVPSVATQDIDFYFEGENQTFSVISAGRLVPLKGFDLSILAFASFLSKLNKHEKAACKLIVVGSGPELVFYKKLAIENKIEKNIQFIEWINRNELLQLFKSSSVFLFPSHEGAGMVVAEALSTGLPVVCLNNCGPGEFITPTCGYAIPPLSYDDTVTELSNALSTLFYNKHQLQQMRLAARERFENNFDWNIRGQQLNHIYNNLKK